MAKLTDTDKLDVIYKALMGDPENCEKLGLYAKVNILWRDRKWIIGMVTLILGAVIIEIIKNIL